MSHVLFSTTTPSRTARGAAASTAWRPLLLGGILPCVALAPVVGLGGWAFHGPLAGWSALGGLGLATAFFLLGFGCLRVVLAAPSFTQVAGAVGVFFLQVLLLLGLIDVLGDMPLLSGRAFALGGLAGALAWQAGQAWVVLRVRVLSYTGTMPGDAA